MINKEDEPGFDPFAEPDAFREEYPAHEPVPVAAVIPKELLEPPPDSSRPEPKQLKCGICFKTFTAKAGWFFGKWRYAGLCLQCADGNTLPQGFQFKRPPVRQMSCPNCGIRRGVDPRLLHNLWHYELTCAHCGGTALAVYRIRATCEVCQEDFNVSERYPKRTCRKCDKEQTKAY